MNAESELPVGDVLDTPRAGPLALRGAALRVGGYGGGMVLALISAPLLIRHLHQMGYGRYVTALSIATIGTALTEGGVNTVALREFASRTGRERDSAMANLLGVRVLLSVLGLIVTVAFAAAVGYSPTIVIGTAVASFGLSIQVLAGLLTVPLQGMMRLGAAAAVDLVRNAIATTMIVALVLADAVGVVPFIAATIPAGVVAVLLAARLAGASIPLRPTVKPAAYAALLRETLPFAVAVALSGIYFRTTVIVVSLGSTALQTGYFSTSFRVVEILISLPVLVIGAAYPIISRSASDDQARFDYATNRIFELSVLSGVWLALVIVLGAHFATDVLGGRAASPAAAVLRIQGVAVAGTFVAVACGYPLLSLHRYRALLLANAGGLVTTLAVSLSLVPVMGAQGAAIATVAAELALAAASLVALKLARTDLALPLSAIPIALLAGGAGLGAGYLLDVHPIVEVLVGTAVYALALVALRRFPPEIGHAIRFKRTIDDKL